MVRLHLIMARPKVDLMELLFILSASQAMKEFFVVLAIQDSLNKIIHIQLVFLAKTNLIFQNM